MAGVKTLADGNVKVVLLAARPADINAITVTEATAVGAKDMSSRILSSDFDLGPTGSDSIPDKPLDAKGNANTHGLSNFGGGLSVFRYFDPATGMADATDDWAYDAVKDKGTTLCLVVRETGKDSGDAIVAGDEYRYYEAETDDPVRGDRSGYIKWRINLAVQYSALDKLIVAGP